MAEKENMILGLDASGAVKGFATLKKSLSAQIGPIEKLTEVGQRFNDSGKRTRVVIKGMTADGDKFTATLKRVGDGWRRVSQTITANTDALKKNKATEKSTSRDAEKELRDRVKWYKEIERAARQVHRVKEQLAKKELRFNQDILRNQIKARQAIQTVENRRTAASFVNRFNQGAIGGGFALPQGAKLADLNRIQSSLAQINNLLATGKVSATRFDQILAHVEGGSRTSFAALTQGEQRAEIALRRLQIAIDQTGKKSGVLGLKLSSILRIFAVQTLHAIFGNFLRAIRQSLDEAASFEKKIGQIQTISQHAQLTTDQWSSSLRKLSDAFGVDVLEVAEGAYDALSNQVNEGVESVLFLEKALTFAKTTASTTAESVNVLTAAINAYQLSSSETDKVAAILFKTIDLGRVKASELAGTLGNTLPVASELGISLEEVSAAISVISNTGVRTDTTLTVLRQLFLELVKPGKELKKLFDDIGVSSGRAAIESLGFIGFLERLKEELDKGGLPRLAEILNDVRPLRGGIGLVSQLDELQQALTETTQGQDAYAKATELALNNAGVAYDKALTKIKNFFVVDLAEPAIVTLGEFIHEGEQAQGVIEDLANTWRGLLIDIKRLHRGEFSKFFEDTDTQGNKLSDKEFTGRVDVLKEAQGKIIDAIKKIDRANAESIDNLGRQTKGKVQLFNSQAAQVRRIATQHQQAIFNDFKEAEKEFKKTQDNIRKFAQEFDEGVLNDSLIGKGFKDNIDALTVSVEKLFEKAASLEINEENLDPLREIFKEADATLGDILDKYNDLISKNEDLIDDLKKAQGEKEFERGLLGLTDAQQIEKIKQKITELRSQGKQLIESFETDKGKAVYEQIFDLIGKIDDIEKKRETRLKKLGITISRKSGADDIEKQSFIEEQNALAQATAELKKRRDLTRQERRDQGIGLEKKIQEGINIDFVKDLGAFDNQILQITNSLKALDTQFKALLDREKTTQAQFLLGTAQLEGLITQSLAGGILKPGKGQAQTADVLLKELREGFLKGKFTPEEIQGKLAEILDRVKSFLPNIEKFNNPDNIIGDTTVGAIVEQMQAEVDRLEKVQNDNFQNEKDRQNFEKQKFILDQQSNEAIGLLRDTLLSNVTPALDRLADALNNIPGRAHGGLVGGRAGVDTNLIRASRDEFIVNEAATRQFYSQLVAMNAGIRPRGFSNGGPVTNVGDINVTVHGGQTSQATIREIGAGLRREVRRGILRMG